MRTWGKKICFVSFCLKFSANEIFCFIVIFNCLCRFVEMGFYTLPEYDSQAPSNYVENVCRHTFIFIFFSD